MSDGANDYSEQLNRQAELAAMSGGDPKKAGMTSDAPMQYAMPQMQGGGGRDAIVAALMAQPQAMPQYGSGGGGGGWGGSLTAYGSPEYADWERQMTQQQQLMQAFRENPYLYQQWQQGSGPGNSGVAGPGGAPSSGFGGGYGPSVGNPSVGNPSVGDPSVGNPSVGNNNNSGWGAQQGFADYGGITGPTSAGMNVGTVAGPGATMGPVGAGTSFSGGWGGFGLGATGVPGVNATAPGLGMNPGWGGLNGMSPAAIAAAMNAQASMGYDSSGNGLGGNVGGIGGIGGDGMGGYGFGIGPGPGGENSVGPNGEAGPY